MSYRFFMSMLSLMFFQNSAFASDISPEIAIKSLLNPGQELVFKFSSGDVYKDLDLGEEWEGILEVRGFPKSQLISVDMYFETSLSISHEGPHLDLVDWLHYKSPWTPLISRSPTEFDIKLLSPSASSYFPFVSKSVFQKAVKKVAYSKYKGAEALQWVELSKKCQSPQQEPCSVSVSKVILRVFEGPKETRKPIKDIVMRIPLGC